MEARDDDFVTQLFIGSTHSYVFFFSTNGKVFVKKVYEVPLAARNAKGRAIVNFLELPPEEKVAIRARGGCQFISVHPVAGFPLYDPFNSLGTRAEKSRYDLARMEPRAADSFVCRHLVDQPRSKSSLTLEPTNHSLFSKSPNFVQRESWPG